MGKHRIHYYDTCSGYIILNIFDIHALGLVKVAMKSHYLHMGIIFTNHRTKWAMVSVANRQITRENTYIKEITNHMNHFYKSIIILHTVYTYLYDYRQVVLNKYIYIYYIPLW